MARLYIRDVELVTEDSYLLKGEEEKVFDLSKNFLSVKII